MTVCIFLVGPLQFFTGPVYLISCKKRVRRKKSQISRKKLKFWPKIVQFQAKLAWFLTKFQAKCSHFECKNIQIPKERERDKNLDIFFPSLGGFVKKRNFSHLKNWHVSPVLNRIWLFLQNWSSWSRCELAKTNGRIEKCSVEIGNRKRVWPCPLIFAVWVKNLSSIIYKGWCAVLHQNFFL